MCFVYKEFSLAKCGCHVKYLGNTNVMFLHSILSKLMFCVYILWYYVRRVFFSLKCVLFAKYFLVRSVLQPIVFFRRKCVC